MHVFDGFPHSTNLLDHHLPAVVKIFFSHDNAFIIKVCIQFCNFIITIKFYCFNYVNSSLYVCNNHFDSTYIVKTVITSQRNYKFNLFLLGTGIWQVCGHGKLSFFEGTQVFVI